MRFFVIALVQTSKQFLRYSQTPNWDPVKPKINPMQPLRIVLAYDSGTLDLITHSVIQTDRAVPTAAPRTMCQTSRLRTVFRFVR
jgi:hypothetical protein